MDRGKTGTTWWFQVNAIGSYPHLLAFWWQHVGPLRGGHWIYTHETTYGLHGNLPRLVSGSIFVPRGQAIKIRTANPFSNVEVRLG